MISATKVREHGKPVSKNPKAKTQESVLALLQKHSDMAMTQKDVSVGLKIKPQQARGALMALVKKAVVIRREMPTVKDSKEHIYYCLSK